LSEFVANVRCWSLSTYSQNLTFINGILYLYQRHLFKWTQLSL